MITRVSCFILLLLIGLFRALSWNSVRFFHLNPLKRPSPALATRWTRMQMSDSNEWWKQGNEVELDDLIKELKEELDMESDEQEDDQGIDEEIDEEYEDEDNLQDEVQAYKKEIGEDDGYSSRNGLFSMSLRDISRVYGFSLSYLGDFVTQLGCPSPLDTKMRVGNFMDDEQMSQLLIALNSLDPFESSVNYQESLLDLSEETGVDLDKLLEICQKHEITLPYGYDSLLHSTLIEQIRRALEFSSEYDKNEEEEEEEEEDLTILQ